MTAPDDLIRRGDVERIISEAVVSRPLHDSPASADRPAWAVRNEIAAAIRALPADPVAEAAGKLAESCRRVPYNADVPDECWEEFDDEAYHAYRAAVAARAKETA